MLRGVGGADMIVSAKLVIQGGLEAFFLDALGGGLALDQVESEPPCVGLVVAPIVCRL